MSDSLARLMRLGSDSLWTFPRDTQPERREYVSSRPEVCW